MHSNHEVNYIDISNAESMESKIAKAVAVRPSQRQLEWQKMELTAFIHFGMNTFCDREWGDGTADPSEFQLRTLDPEQWVTILQQAGFQELILTCKHHDGFCLWPSRYTEYSVKNSPFENGKGDVVRAVSDACRRHGMKFGIYLSPWDCHDARYGDSPAYNAYFLNQLTELLTQYGDIYEVWFDGACAEGPNGRRQEYDWDAYYSLVRKLQPQAVISIEGPDVRWVGNEVGKGRQEEWSVVPGKILDREQCFVRLAALAVADDLASDKELANLPRDCDCLYWSPAQVDTSIRQGWFYHSWEDDNIKSLYELVKIYDSSVGANAVLLLNIPPNREGRISKWDERRVLEFGNYLKKAFSDDIVTGVSSRAAEDGYRIDISLKPDQWCNCLVLGEDIEQGQRVAGFRVTAVVDGEEKCLATGRTVGYKRIVEFGKVKTDRITVIIDEYRAEPHIGHVGVYLRPDVVCPPKIRRNLDGMVEIVCGNGAVASYSIDGGECVPYTGPFLLDTSGKVEAYANYDEAMYYAKSTLSAAVQFGILKKKWTVCQPQPQTPELLKYVRGEKEHYCFKGFPCDLVIDLGEQVCAVGVQYQPVRSALDFLYNAYEIEIAVSRDNEHYKTVYAGKLDNIKNNPVSQSISFAEPEECRYLKFTAISGFDEEIAGIGAIDVITR